MWLLRATLLLYIAPLVADAHKAADGVAWPWSPVVTTTYGSVRGERKGNLDVFTKVPFATPPTGALRFKTAVPPSPWRGVKDARAAISPMCAQMRTAGTYMGSEDCLYLHVTAPVRRKGAAPLPVMFWIFGGGYTIGSADEFGFYDAKNFAEKHQVVVVQPNYRVGVFGFLAHEVFRHEDPHNSTGNMGVQDQRLALEWTRDNIARFGGDPKRVLIFGESAGAFSVCWHLVNPLSRGLFHAAIMESGTCSATQFFMDATVATTFGDIFATEHVGCNATALGQEGFLRCMRGKKTKEVMDSIPGAFNPNWPAKQREARGLAVLPPAMPDLAPIMPWGPVIDGTDTGLRQMPQRLLDQGLGNYVPTILGTNRDEGNLFIPAIPFIKGLEGHVAYPYSDEDVTFIAKHFFPRNYSEVLAMYTKAAFNNSNIQRISQMITHDFFACASRRAATAISAHGAPAWLYQFNYSAHWKDNQLMGDYHSSEMYFVWGNEWPALVHHFNAKDWQMSDTFGKFWSQLARNGTVNTVGPGQPGFWPPHDTKTMLHAAMDVPFRIGEKLFKKYCDFWDQQKE